MQQRNQNTTQDQEFILAAAQRCAKLLEKAPADYFHNTTLEQRAQMFRKLAAAEYDAYLPLEEALDFQRLCEAILFTAPSLTIQTPQASQRPTK